MLTANAGNTPFPVMSVSSLFHKCFPVNYQERISGSSVVFKALFTTPSLQETGEADSLLGEDL